MTVSGISGTDFRRLPLTVNNFASKLDQARRASDAAKMAGPRTINVNSATLNATHVEKRKSLHVFAEFRNSDAAKAHLT